MAEGAVVIVGGGQAGFQVAASLRDEGYVGAITIVGEEPGLPYQRPPLSKGYLLGKVPAAQVELRPPAFYSDHRIDVITGDKARAIDRDGRAVTLDSGARLPYEHLVLATGARPRMPALPGSALQGVVSLRTRADADSLLARLPRARRMVVIGAGFIGLEVAVAVRELGLDVHLLEFTDRALKRSVSSHAADFLAKALIDRGVRMSFHTGAVGYTGDNGDVTGVITTTGETLPADIVVVGIGVEPNVELAVAAGLQVQDGILVDAQLLTDDCAISAVGDCARFATAQGGELVRIESVQNSADHARCVAARIAGRPHTYDKVPWFWSDQAPHRLQIAGVAQAGDSAVVRGNVATAKFSVFRFRGSRLAAVESINSAADHMAARKLLAAQVEITPEQAADPTMKLAALAPAS